MLPLALPVLLLLLHLPSALPQPPGTITTLIGGATEVGAPAHIPGTGAIVRAVLADPQAPGGYYYSTSTSVRRVTPAGLSYPLAGAYLAGGYSGDGGPATLATLSGPVSLAANASGLFIGDQSAACRLRALHPVPREPARRRSG